MKSYTHTWWIQWAPCSKEVCETVTVLRFSVGGFVLQESGDKED